MHVVFVKLSGEEKMIHVINKGNSIISSWIFHFFLVIYGFANLSSSQISNILFDKWKSHDQSFIAYYKGQGLSLIWRSLIFDLVINALIKKWRPNSGIIVGFTGTNVQVMCSCFKQEDVNSIVPVYFLDLLI